MTATRPSWRSRRSRRATGSTCRRPTTQRASWYESMGIMVVCYADGSGQGEEPLQGAHRDARAADARAPGREQPPRRQGATGPQGRPRGLRAASSASGVLIKDFLYGRRRPQLAGKRGRPPRGEGGRGDHLHELRRDDRDRRQRTPRTTRSPHARRPAPGQPASPTRWPTRKVQFDSGELGSARPASLRRRTATRGRRREPQGRHLHLLLPDPSVHARRLPRSQELGSSARLRSLQERRSAAPGRTSGFLRFSARVGRRHGQPGRSPGLRRSRRVRSQGGRPESLPKGGTMRRALIGAVVALAAALMLAPVASAVDEVNTKKLRKGVTAARHPRSHAGAPAHRERERRQRAPRRSPGYDASLAYVERAHEAGGLRGRRATSFRLRGAGSRTPRRRCSVVGARPRTPRAPPRTLATTSWRSSPGAGNVTAPLVATERHA